jgi:hypothetical protein
MAKNFATSCPDCSEGWDVGGAAKKGALRSIKDAVIANAKAANPFPTDNKEALEFVLTGGTSGVSPKDVVDETKNQISLAEYEETVMEGQGLIRDGDKWVCPHCEKAQYDVKWA